MLLVQIVDLLIGMVTSCLIIRSSLVARTAADNSILGIFIALSGASLDFAMIREQ